MTSALSTTAGSALAASAPEWERKLELVKSMVAKGCSQDEFALLCHLAKTYQLDPLAREIWAIKYGNNPATIFVGHAGLINLALRSGKLDGMTCEIINPDSDDPVAKATVWRNDMTHPIEAEVYFSEYGKDAKNPLWKSKPRTMLRKTAEVHALRRAFALSGLYTEEEMDHVPREVPDTSRSVPAQVTHVHRPEPTPSQVIPDSSIPVVRCDVCGKGTDQYPDIRIREKDGKNICGSCQRKAEKAQTEKEMHVPSSAAPKAIPTGIVPPTNGIPAPAAHFVCGRCGRQMAAEEKSGREMFGKPVCASCAAADGRQPTPEGEA